MIKLRNLIGLTAISAVFLATSGCDRGDEKVQKQASDVVEAALPDIPIDSANGDPNGDTVSVPIVQGLIHIVDIKSNNNLMAIEYPDSYWKSYSGTDFSKDKSDFEVAMAAAFKGQALPKGWKKSTKAKRCKVANGHVNGDTASPKCKHADTDLSISNNKASFIAFILRKKSQNVNQTEKIVWRFVEERTDTRDQSQDDHIIKRHMAAGDHYSYLRKMDKNGVFEDGEITQCDVVGGYFVANGNAAYEDAVNQGDPDPEYLHRFNLYTEIHSTDGTNTEIPVIIDPDVRWPGGTGEGGG